MVLVFVVYLQKSRARASDGVFRRGRVARPDVTNHYIMRNHRYCVIMCGGIGTRFWPYSRTDLPKQFIDFLGTGRSLLQMSYDRALTLVDNSHVVVVTNAAYVDKIREQLPDLLPENILAEPARRNTAPCIAWAAHHIYALDPKASMIVAPSDHLILREDAFTKAVVRGFEFVESKDALLTLGITPTRPETGYGYIQIGPEVETGILKVKTFTEKPDLELAKVFVDSGEFFWNSGIFIWRASVILEAMRQYAPDLAREFDKGADAFGTPREKEFIADRFPCCPSISIDYSVMEKARNVYVECVDLGWSDLGTWGSLYESSPRDFHGNVARNCEVKSYDSEGCIFAVRDSGKLIVASGLKDYIIADSGDILLIHPRSKEQEIRQIVVDIEEKFGDRYL